MVTFIILSYKLFILVSLQIKKPTGFWRSCSYGGNLPARSAGGSGFAAWDFRNYITSFFSLLVK